MVKQDLFAFHLLPKAAPRDVLVPFGKQQEAFFERQTRFEKTNKICLSFTQDSALIGSEQKEESSTLNAQSSAVHSAPQTMCVLGVPNQQ
jgi:hypothetical protein